MKPIIFSDLDDTIFQTARKMTEEPKEALLASRAGNGSHSYMTDSQNAMFKWLYTTTQFIPVTARSSDAIARCNLPFNDYQVLSNGAMIMMPDGSVDEIWMDRTRKISADHAGLLALMKDFVESRNADNAVRHWIVEEQGCNVYYCVKSNGEERVLDRFHEKLTALSAGLFMVHRNGNNLSFTPKDISKRAAVEYLIEKTGGSEDRPIWGMGDSLTDLPFMEACQMLVIPTGSQAHKSFQGGK
jgi:hydroxymethylpyrimidine pyrophosphatase-like HAD family hydrolase